MIFMEREQLKEMMIIIEIVMMINMIRHRRKGAYVLRTRYTNIREFVY